MKHKLRLLVLLMVMITINSVINAQEKYAVLITGDYAIEGIPLEHQWNQGQGKNENGDQTEFWYDTYLMWEMLIKEPDQGGMGYTNQNVFVLFADGYDFYFDNILERYTAALHGYEHITDYSATLENVENVFNGFATGTGGFPQVTEDDFLFVWSFDHGGPFTPPPLNDTVYLKLMYGEVIWDYEFAALLDNINAHKKVFWMQQCRSGGFVNDLEGNNTFMHTACHSMQYALTADNEDKYGNTVEENEIDPITLFEYPHGEFNFHTYSATVGESPAYVDNYNGQPYTDVDLNMDNYISVLESYDWEDTHESILSEDPVKSDLGNIGSNTSLLYPTLLHTDISGEGIEVSYRGLIGISKDIHVTSGNQLRFITNADIYLLNEVKLIIDDGANLVLEDNTSVFGTNCNNQIEVNGSIQVGQGVSFTSDSVNWIGLVINNDDLNLSLNNVSFENCMLLGHPNDLLIENSDFTNSGISFIRGNILLNHTDFTNSYVGISYAKAEGCYAIISDCDFINTENVYNAISIETYPIFNIEDCSIIYFEGNGIEIYNSGSHPSGSQLITNNFIKWNGQFANWTAGISLYHSYADIHDNQLIAENPYGIQCLNNSQVSIIGNKWAEYYYETQQIKDNDINQVYATHGSFPHYFKFNTVMDEDNDCLVYYHVQGEAEAVNVTWNYWGENFVAEDDLCPIELFIFEPVWELLTGNPGKGDDELAFDAATLKVKNGDYTGAKAGYQQLIADYSVSKFAQAAMKELFSLEVVAGNNYEELKNYFNTLQNNANLEKLADHLANFCDIKIENWQTAIEWFENIIEIPPSYEDSLFAIIDLSYTYFLMENSGYKSAYTGKLAQYKFKSNSEFEKSRDYHIELLFKNDGQSVNNEFADKLIDLKTGSLSQNIPNPCSDVTSIFFNIEKAALVSIRIINHLGMQQKLIEMPNSETGINKLELNTAELPAGIYFYSLIIDGKVSDTKKMVIVK